MLATHRVTARLEGADQHERIRRLERSCADYDQTPESHSIGNNFTNQDVPIWRRPSEWPLPNIEQVFYVCIVIRYVYYASCILCTHILRTAAAQCRRKILRTHVAAYRYKFTKNEFMLLEFEKPEYNAVWRVKTAVAADAEERTM